MRGVWKHHLVPSGLPMAKRANALPAINLARAQLDCQTFLHPPCNISAYITAAWEEVTAGTGASLALAARLQQGFPAQMSPGTTPNARYDMQAVLAARMSLLTVT